MAKKRTAKLSYTDEAILRPRTLLFGDEWIAVGGVVETQVDPPDIPRVIREATQAELAALKATGGYDHLIVDDSESSTDVVAGEEMVVSTYTDEKWVTVSEDN